MSSSGTAADHGAEQVGTLRHRGADQQAAVAAAGDGELLRRRCSPRATRYSAAAMKSSNTFCLSLEHAGAVPRLAVLAAAAQVGQRVDAAALQPATTRAHEGRRHRDVEPAVAGEERRVRAASDRASRAWTRNIDTRVPSREVYHSCLTSYREPSTGASTAAHVASVPSGCMEKTLFGTANEVNER